MKYALIALVIAWVALIAFVAWSAFGECREQGFGPFFCTALVSS